MSGGDNTQARNTCWDWTWNKTSNVQVLFSSSTHFLFKLAQTLEQIWVFSRSKMCLLLLEGILSELLFLSVQLLDWTPVILLCLELPVSGMWTQKWPLVHHVYSASVWGSSLCDLCTLQTPPPHTHTHFPPPVPFSLLMSTIYPAWELFFQLVFAAQEKRSLCSLTHAHLHAEWFTDGYQERIDQRKSHDRQSIKHQIRDGGTRALLSLLFLHTNTSPTVKEDTWTLHSLWEKLHKLKLLLENGDNIY